MCRPGSGWIGSNVVAGRPVVGQLESPAPGQRLCCRDGETAGAHNVRRTPRGWGLRPHRPAARHRVASAAARGDRYVAARGDRSEGGSARCILPPRAFRFASVQPRAAVASPAESASATHLHDFKLTHYPPLRREPAAASARCRIRSSCAEQKLCHLAHLPTAATMVLPTR